MSDRTVTHATYTIERSYPAAPERVFRVFSDPAKKRRWYAEGERANVEEFTMDFRVGGRDRLVFSTPQGFQCVSESVYQDIRPNSRIVFAYTMTVNGNCISSSQGTFEFLPAPTGTTLLFTEQAAFFEGADGPEMRKQGWTELLSQVAAELARPETTL